MWILAASFIVVIEIAANYPLFLTPVQKVRALNLGKLNSRDTNRDLPAHLKNKITALSCKQLALSDIPRVILRFITLNTSLEAYYQSGSEIRHSEWATGWGGWDSNPGWVCLRKIHTCFGSRQAPMQESLGVNRLDHETNNSSLCNNDVRNEWSSSYVHSSRVKGNIRLTIREKNPKLIPLPLNNSCPQFSVIQPSIYFYEKKPTTNKFHKNYNTNALNNFILYLS